MAKMFYTLEEAAAKLGKSEGEVREMAQSGRIQEFRDRDKLMFKVDQIDLLSGPGGDEADMSSVIPLADSVGGPTLNLGESVGGASFGGDKIDIGAESGPGLGSPSGMSGSGLGLSASKGGSAAGASRGGSRRGGSGLDLTDSDNPKAKTGVSIFDADDLEKADPSAVTQMTSGGLDDLSLEPVGSGSGLMELARESDDTSLGAVDFLQEVGAGEDRGEAPMSASGLFGGTGEEPEQAAAAAGAGAVPAFAFAEAFDGPGSGLVGGLSLGALVALGLATFVVISGLVGAGSGGLTSMVADKFWIAIGALAGVAAVAGVVGMLLGKRT